MDKVSKIGVAVCVLLLIVWFVNRSQKPPEEAKEPSARITVSASPIAETAEEINQPAPSPKPVVVSKSVPDQQKEISFSKQVSEEIMIDTPLLSASLSPYGGVVRKLILKENLETGIRGLPSDPTGDVVLMETSSPLKSLGWLDNLTCLKMDSTQEGLTVRFIGNTTDGNFEISKEYVFNPDSYLVNLKVKVRNISSEKLALDSGAHLVCGSMKPIDPGDSLGVDISTPNEVLRTTDPTEGLISGHIDWLGMKTKYFTSIVKPIDGPATAYRITGKPKVAQTDKAMLGCSRGQGPSDYMYLCSTLEFEDVVIPSGEGVDYSYLLFLGPANYDLLAAEGHGFEDVIDLGLLSPVCKAIIWLLNRIYSVIGSYGWAIIILTLLVKVVLWPLTHKSYKSMKEMQHLQPKIAELKEKCKGDSKKLQAETMELYKEHGVNPMGGCLPMILQMPILFALFTALRNTILLRNAPFWIIPGRWIQNLSGPDQIATLPQSFPIIGNQVNILPLLMGLTFYLQQKFTPQAPAASDQAAQQQKMMATLMPAIFTLMFYSLPSGLNLYFTLSTVITIIQQGALKKKTV